MEGFFEINEIIKSETELDTMIDVWLFTDDVIDSELNNIIDSNGNSEFYWDGDRGISQYISGFARIITYKTIYPTDEQSDDFLITLLEYYSLETTSLRVTLLWNAEADIDLTFQCDDEFDAISIDN